MVLNITGMSALYPTIYKSRMLTFFETVNRMNYMIILPNKSVSLRLCLKYMPYLPTILIIIFYGQLLTSKQLLANNDIIYMCYITFLGFWSCIYAWTIMQQYCIMILAFWQSLLLFLCIISIRIKTIRGEVIQYHASLII